MTGQWRLDIDDHGRRRGPGRVRSGEALRGVSVAVEDHDAGSGRRLPEIAEWAVFRIVVEGLNRGAVGKLEQHEPARTPGSLDHLERSASRQISAAVLPNQRGYLCLVLLVARGIGDVDVDD